MTVVNELIVAIVGGVITAIILEFFGRPRQATDARMIAIQNPGRRESLVDQLVRLILAVAGGIAIALIGGRLLIQMDVLPRGVPTRIGLLVAGTVVCWLVLQLFRRR